MFAKEEGVPVDAAALATRVARRSPKSWPSRPSRNRSRERWRDVEAELCHLCQRPLAGFGGSGNTFVYQDLADFPSLESACSATRPLAAKDAGLQRADRGARSRRCAVDVADLKARSRLLAAPTPS
jgi:5-methyltetrahydropteroyltriglutamate--homocysteine methyltransferase